MIKKLSYGLVLLSSVLLLVSCSTIHPIMNIQNQAVTQGLTTSQVKQCIETAAAEKQWHTHQAKPGVMDAWINVRSHYAAVVINYTNKAYSINYKSSRNLEAQNGMIHRNYNKWVTLLDRRIQSCVQAVKIKKSKK